MPDVCYKKNYLKQVIAKVDFAQPLLEISNDSLIAVVAKIKSRFPISEQATGVTQKVNIDLKADNIQSSRSEFPQWIFHGRDRDKTMIINQLFLNVVLTKYKSEADFREDMIAPISQVISSHHDALIKRTGVRFVNIFDFGIPHYKNAKEFFSDSISCYIANMSTPETCVRSLLINEFLIDEVKVRVQSGYFNPDYPAVIRRFDFVLDIDAYIDFPHQIKDVDQYLTRFHGIIQSIFESHITQKLRDEVLNG